MTTRSHRLRTCALLVASTGAVLGAGALAGFGASPVSSSLAAPAEAPSTSASIEVFPENAAGLYAVDVVHTNVLFKIKHARVSNFYGRFNGIEGTFTLAENPVESTFELTIDTTSVDTKVAKRDDHLRSPDFFNVGQFPAATFKSSGIVADDDGTYTLSGEMTLNGVTKAIDADLTFTGTGKFQGKPVAGFEAIFHINRSDFGITTYLGPLGDDVEIIVAVEGKKQ